MSGERLKKALDAVRKDHTLIEKTFAEFNSTLPTKVTSGSENNFKAEDKKKAAKEGGVIMLHVKQTNRYVERECIVVSSNDEGITVKDLETKMIIAYPFYKLDYDALYEREVAPNVSNMENKTEGNILSKFFNS